MLQEARRGVVLDAYNAHGSTPGTGTITEVYIGVLPFVACVLLVLGLLIALPEIVGQLPDLAEG